MRRPENEGTGASYNDDPPTQPTRCWRPQKRLPAPIFDSSVPFVSRSAPCLQSAHGANGFNHDMTGQRSEGGRERKPHVDWTRLPKAETTSMRGGHHISTSVCIRTKLARQLRQRSAGERRDWSGEDEMLSRNWDATISFPRFEVAFLHIHGQGPMGQ